MVNMGQSPIPHYYYNRIVREEPGQTWGQAPIPHYYHDGVMREERSCGTHILCEHVLSGKLITNVACKTDRFHIPTNRVLPSAGARAELANCAFLSIGWGAARGLASSMFPAFGCGLLVEKTAFLLSTVGRAYGWLPNVITKSCGQDILIIMRILLLASHNLCQHVFSDKLIADDANGDSNFHTIANRVRKGHG